MKPRILLTGKNGQVGFEVHRLLLALGQVVAPDRHALDLLDANSIRQTVRDVRPQLIVNAAAYTAVDAAETDQVNAHAINAEAPAILAEEAKKIGAALVHYSTVRRKSRMKRRTPRIQSTSTGKPSSRASRPCAVLECRT